MHAKLRVPAIIAIGSLALAGCASGDLFGSSSGGDLTTQAVPQTQAQKIDPACGNLALEIDTLRREGVAEKVEKAAAKKYKMSAADLTKANQLNRANAEFQAKCSTLPRSAAMPTAPVPEAATVKSAAPAKKAAALAQPAAAKIAAQ